MYWLPEPPRNTPVCLGFDGSDVADFTVIQAETADGFSFTPRIAGDRPTIWNPAEFHDHRIPRAEVTAAVADLFDRFQIERMYCDPPGWRSEIETWAAEHGDEHVIAWETYRPKQMHESLERFVSDLHTKRIRHDGCPIAANHIANAVKATRRNDTYVLAKASKEQKIDAAMGRVLAHEAAADAIAAGWGRKKSRKNARMIVIC
jgi:phage terminase large subunit-like protein